MAQDLCVSAHADVSPAKFIFQSGIGAFHCGAFVVAQLFGIDEAKGTTALFLCLYLFLAFGVAPGIFVDKWYMPQTAAMRGNNFRIIISES